MAAYLVLLLAILSRLLPFAFHTTSVGFTAVGGGLLYFGARRSRWQTIPAVLALMATDWYLTTQEEWIANYQRLSGDLFSLTIDEFVEKLAPPHDVGGVQMHRQQIGLEPALPLDVMPSVVVDDEKLRIVDFEKMISVDYVLSRFRIRRDVLRTPILVV